MKREYKNSGFAGEMLVAAELARRGFQVMLGNVGSHKTVRYDMAAADPETDRLPIGISVKSLKKANSFLIDPEKVTPSVRYVFVITGSAGELAQFFVATGKELLDNEARLWDKWGRSYPQAGHRGIGPKALSKFKDHWEALEEDYDP